MEYVMENPQPADKNKNLGCWARFKSLFEDRGFDLEYEYGPRNVRPINLLGENQETEGYRRIEERKASIDKNNRPVGNSSDTLDGELSGVINFYEQFATLGDDTKEDPEVWRKSVRHRVSMRPSALLTNIAEEPGDGDDEIEVVSQNELNNYTI